MLRTVLVAALAAVVATYAIFIAAAVAVGGPIPDGLLFGSVIGAVVTLANIAGNIGLRKLGVALEYERRENQR